MEFISISRIKYEKGVKRKLFLLTQFTSSSQHATAKLQMDYACTSCSYETPLVNTSFLFSFDLFVSDLHCLSD